MWDSYALLAAFLLASGFLAYDLRREAESAEVIKAADSEGAPGRIGNYLLVASSEGAHLYRVRSYRSPKFTGYALRQKDEPLRPWEHMGVNRKKRPLPPPGRGRKWKWI